MTTQGSGQQQHQVTPPPKSPSRTRGIILILTILLTIIFVIAGLRTAGWSSGISLLLSAVSVLLGLFQLLVPLPGSPPLVSSKRKPSGSVAEYEILRKQLEKTHKSTGKGALVVYTRRGLVGWRAIRLLSGETQGVYTYVAERSVNRRIIYVAVFRDLTPGIYHVSLHHPTIAGNKYLHSEQDGAVR